MYRISGKGFLSQSGAVTGAITLNSEMSNLEWQEKQQDSLEEYLSHHDRADEAIAPYYKLLSNYIAAALKDRGKQKILDIGCGVGERPPPYILPLQETWARAENIYIGLDPISVNVDSRRYPFICGRLEDLPGTLEDRFDVFLFSTSLDHFEDIGAVARLVKQLANENAICIFWVGVHDPARVAEEWGAAMFGRTFSSLHPVRALRRLSLLVARLPYIYFSLLLRTWRLRRRAPLDQRHFYYFTEQSLSESLLLFGTISDWMRVPASNSVFATVKITSEYLH